MKFFGSSLAHSLAQVALTLLLFDGVPFASAQSGNCANMVQRTQPLPCQQIQARQRVGGSFVQIWHYSTGFQNTDHDKMVMRLMKEVADDALPRWRGYSPSLDVSFLLVNRFEQAWGGLTSNSPDGEKCFVRIPAHFTKGKDQTEHQIRHIIAHELAHCVEFRKSPNQGYTPNARWHIEGVAEYLGDELYPPLESEKGSWMKKYNPSTSLLTQVEEASLFWQFLDNDGYSPKSIVDLQAELPALASAAATRQDASGRTKITSKFPDFASAFKSGDIKFSNNQAVPTKLKIQNQNLVLQLAADGQKINQPVSIPTFTMKTYTTRFWPGQNVKLSFETRADGTVMQYRKEGATTWDKLDAAGTSIKLECTDSDQQYEFLLTSTADAAKPTGTLIFERIAMEDCPCQTSTNIRVDPCLVGSWKLNFPSIRRLLAAASTQVTGGTPVRITHLGVGGAHTFNVARTASTTDSGASAALNFNNFHIDISASSRGVTIDSKTTVNGHVDAGLVMLRDRGSYCLKDPRATGQSKFVASGFNFAVPLSEGYGESVYVKYTCTAKTLNIEGWNSGVRSYLYSYDRA